VLGRADWRAAGVSGGAAAAAAAAAVAAAHLVTGAGPVLLALVALGIFAATYLGLALALKHPDAARLWKLVS